MEPVYRGFKVIYDTYIKMGNPKDTPENAEAREALAWIHNHTCWLNPTMTVLSRRTKKMCKRFCKKNGIPKEEGWDHYNCDVCPNLITYYKEGNNFLFALGNAYLYEKEGKINDEQ